MTFYTMDEGYVAERGQPVRPVAPHQTLSDEYQRPLRSVPKHPRHRAGPRRPFDPCHRKLRRSRLAPAACARPTSRPQERKHAAKLAAYEDRLRELTRRIRAFGARPIFVTQHRADYRVVEGRVLSPVMKDGTLS